MELSMNKRGLYLLLIVSAIILGGCDFACRKSNDKAIDNKSKDTVREEKESMTERQEEIFRSYGLSEERIAQMKQDGMNFSEKSFADATIYMLDHLEKKYNVKFEVVGGDIPGLFMHDYWIKARACEGEHAGKEFDVYHKGERGIFDGYINFLKEEEAVEALKDLIHEKFGDVIVLAEMTGEYGDQITLDMKGKELLHKVRYYYYIVITSSQMNESKFISRVEEIEQYIDDNDVISSGIVFYLKDDVDINITDSEIFKMIKNNNDNEVVRWSEYISTH